MSNGIKLQEALGYWLLAQILAVVAICVFGGQGCTDAEWDSYRQYGSRAEMKCHSGNSLIFHGVSTGKVLNEQNSDGYRDAGRLSISTIRSLLGSTQRQEMLSLVELVETARSSTLM